MDASLTLGRTRRALVGACLLSEPLCTAYSLIAFILYKELGASLAQITLLVLLKPVITIFSLYWSSSFRNLKGNLLWAGFWMRVPFLLCPWIDSPIFLIAAAVNYMFFFRAGAPAWMEILKCNLPKCGRLFSLSSALGYLEGGILAILIGFWLDAYPGHWRWLFFGTAAIGLLTLLIQAAIPLAQTAPTTPRPSWREFLTTPWKDSYQLMKSRPDFTHFQWGYMICGLGIMLIQPVLPLFALDNLHISYAQMATAISIAKGAGYVLSSPFWTYWMERSSIFRVAAFVFAALGSFPLLLSLGSSGWLYLAYFCYGIGQGGSHLAWNMSGPHFAGKEDSSRFTSINVALGGLRGAIAPSLGGWLALMVGSTSVLWIGGICCLLAGLFVATGRERVAISNSPPAG